MSSPTLSTPPLKGKDAERFLKNLSRPRPSSVPIIDLAKLDRALDKWAEKNGRKKS